MSTGTREKRVILPEVFGWLIGQGCSMIQVGKYAAVVSCGEGEGKVACVDIFDMEESKCVLMDFSKTNDAAMVAVEEWFRRKYK